LAKLSVEQALLKAKSLAKKGELAEARKLYTAILAAFPNNKKAQQGQAALAKANQSGANSKMGSLLLASGNLEKALPFIKTALEADFSVAQHWFNYIHVLFKLDRFSESAELLAVARTKGCEGQAFDELEEMLSSSEVELKNRIQGLQKLDLNGPNAYFINFGIGEAWQELGKLEEAIEAYTKALAIKPDYAEAYSNMGAALADQGKPEEAIEVYNKALAIKPDYAEAYSNMGNALKEQGMLEEAIEAYTKALAIKPDYAEAYSNMGVALADQGKLEEAIEVYNKALAIKPDYAEAYSNMGMALKDQGKLEEAIEAYNKALAIKPDFAEAYSNMGVALADQGKLEEAIEVYNKALAIKPDFAEAYNNLGNALKEQGKLEEAIEAYNKALAIKPDYAEAYSNMGVALADQGKPEEAIEVYNKALAIKPDYAEAYSNMGNALADQGKPEEAIEAYNKALAIKPDYAEAYSNMGIALKDQGKLEEAIEAYNKALAIKPDYAEAHMILSFVLLNANRLSEGFAEYEWRWKTKEGLKTERHFSQPLWNGKTSLKGKRILLWCEQGVGDTINWSHCLPFLASQAQHCILECQEKLIPLMARSFPNVEVKAENRSLDSERDDFDLHLPMGSLFQHLVSKISSCGKADAFLVPDPVRVNFWRKRLHSIGNGPYVGISWKSSNMKRSRLPNYAPIFELSPVLTLPGITFINLQSTDFENDLAKIKNDLGVSVHNFDDLDHYDNLDDVAALSSALDIVVSTHNALPIITAGVGTPTKLASWEQSSWNNNLFSPHGPFINKFQKNTWERWDEVFRLISRDMLLDFAK